MKITVARAFLIKGVRQEPGTSLELADPFARELVSLGKAVPAAPTPAPAGPMTTQTTPAAVPGKRVVAKTATASKED